MATISHRYTNGINGSELHNGAPGPSRSPNPLPTPTSPEPEGTHQVQDSPQVQQPILLGATNNSNCLDHLYHNGFRLGHWADTVVHVQGHAYNMHALLLGRSPYLAHLMSTTPLVQSGGGNGPLRSIYIPIEHEPEITPESVTIAIGYLYSSLALGAISPVNARAVLAAGCLLGGMDELCQYAFEVSRSSIAVESIDDWLRFIERGAPREDPGSGTATPTTPQSPGFQGIFQSYASRLRDEVMQFLIVGLPSQLQAFSPDVPTPDGVPSGVETLLNIYSHIPFDIFKKAVESPLFAVGSDQARFKFAKLAIERRKKAGGNAYLANREESVVLGFGVLGGGGSNVVVTKKVKKRPLWKVSG